jgi:RsiW-degrading membrane proteinase PrsW (M82 family)
MAITAYQQTIIIAVLSGVIPTLLWLRFWLNEDRERSEPRVLIFLCFLIGGLGVLLATPLEKFVAGIITDRTTSIAIWASIEEIIKYFSVSIIAFGTSALDEPIDYPMYLIAGALGFAAVENTFFLIKPILAGEATISFITGNLRFLGSTLLHAVTSALIGIFLGLAFYETKAVRKIYFIFGMIGAIALHTVFNFFIMDNEHKNMWNVFGFLWVIGIIIVLLLEKLKRMRE